jgi:hypothetical protein
VIGNSSITPSTLRSFNGSLSEARGRSRCSLCTPTACVGTRTNRLGWGFLNSGMTRSVGTRGATGASGTTIGIAAAAVDSVCGDSFSQATARFVALISPLSEMKQPLLANRALLTDFVLRNPRTMLGCQNDTNPTLCQPVENSRSVLSPNKYA